jgi:DNA topoisomerase-1
MPNPTISPAESARKRNTRRAVVPTPEIDPKTTAQQAKLRYVTDNEPGILRAKKGKGFSYRDPDGRLVKDKAVLARIRSLAIPPAWKHVWICLHEDGHLQATGRDQRGRKQYRYHPRWRSIRDETKFDKMLAFAHSLPTIRKVVDEDLAKPGFTKRKVVAAVVRLLELSLIRVGNSEYARTNDTYGLTTMRDEHASILGSSVEFRFRGKSGIKHKVEVRDRKLAKVVAKCQAIPGQELFQYKDENGDFRVLTSADVNEYLREVAGADFTAKDFRTWAGTVLAAVCLREMHDALEEAKATKATLTRAVERVAERLGNTPSVCRKAYIHPAVCESYLAGTLLDLLAAKKPTPTEGLDEYECLVIEFLSQMAR